MSDGSQVVKVTATPIVPDELHGFSVTVGVGPYPPQQPRPGEHAVYAELIPMTQKALTAMHHIGRQRILGMVPITPEAATDVKAEPGGQLAEMLATQALAAAAQLARPIATS